MYLEKLLGLNVIVWTVSNKCYKGLLVKHEQQTLFLYNEKTERTKYINEKNVLDVERMNEENENQHTNTNNKS